MKCTENGQWPCMLFHTLFVNSKVLKCGHLTINQAERIHSCIVPTILSITVLYIAYW